MQIILFDTLHSHTSLLPLTYTKPIAALRLGIITISEKWSHYFNDKVSVLTLPYLQKKYATVYSDTNVYVDGSLLPSVQLVEAIQKLQVGQKLVKDGRVLAFCTQSKLNQIDGFEYETLTSVEFSNGISQIVFPWNVFQLNGEEIRADIELLKKKKSFQRIEDPHTKLYAEENIYVEEGAEVKGAILDASHGPIYLGKNSKIGLGSVVIGPFALCEGAQLSPVCKVRGDSTIGPYCKVGGEVSNVVFQAYSNKGHDGFLGNAVLGEWCNLGADTNASNLKNNYSDVKAWNYQTESYGLIGSQFCGLMMGDHSKSGINTMFNTATSVGAFCNVYGSDFPSKFIPSFSWGSAASMQEFKIEKCFEMAENMMKRRGVELTEVDKEIYTYVFNETKKYRTF